MALEDTIYNQETADLGLCSTALRELCDQVAQGPTTKIVSPHSSEEISLVEVSLRLAADLSAKKVHIREGNYQRVLGRGGFGIVIYAESDGNRYAIKLFNLSSQNTMSEKKDVDDKLAKMCAHEAAMQKKARQIIGNVPPIVKAGQDPFKNTPYIVMEYLEGETFGTFKRRRNLAGNLTQMQILASYLNELHKEGVIHNDVKSENLMVVDGRPFLIDYGLTFEVGKTVTHLNPADNAVLGTPAYIAPECLIPGRIEDKITPQSDQYGLGIMLYEAATGKNPFRNMTPDQIFKIKVNDLAGRLDMPASLPANCPAHVKAIVLRCTSTDPKNRYASCSEVEQELKEIIKEIN